MPATPLLLPACLALALAGCHDHDDHPHGDATDPIEEGCPHLEFGPDIALDLAADNPPIVTVHTRYPVTLADEADGYGGQIELGATGGDYYFLLDRVVPFNLTDAAGAPVEATHVTTDPGACTAAAVVHHYDLAEATYTLTFGPTDEASLQMAVHRPGEDHSHAH